MLLDDLGTLVLIVKLVHANTDASIWKGAKNLRFIFIQAEAKEKVSHSLIIL